MPPNNPLRPAFDLNRLDQLRDELEQAKRAQEKIIPLGPALRAKVEQLAATASSISPERLLGEGGKGGAIPELAELAAEQSRLTVLPAVEARLAKAVEEKRAALLGCLREQNDQAHQAAKALLHKIDADEVEDQLPFCGHIREAAEAAAKATLPFTAAALWVRVFATLGEGNDSHPEDIYRETRRRLELFQSGKPFHPAYAPEGHQGYYLRDSRMIAAGTAELRHPVPAQA